HALTALGRAVRWANPDPGAWAEDQPRHLDAPAATLSLRRRPLREPGGGQVSPAIVLWVAGNRPGAPVPSLGIPAEARVVRVEDAPGGARRLVSFGGEEAGLRALTLAHLEEGLVVAAACTGSATTWRVLERECRAFLDSLAVEPAR
ncbi:MAG TPA: hypothetical protein VEP68_05805, partial [Anaeromyxobacteraceae bacterium]|nr:hypothetical protein [Anaeromyxobacteraceae bacterium]